MKAIELNYSKRLQIYQNIEAQIQDMSILQEEEEMMHQAD